MHAPRCTRQWSWSPVPRTRKAGRRSPSSGKILFTLQGTNPIMGHASVARLCVCVVCVRARTEHTHFGSPASLTFWFCYKDTLRHNGRGFTEGKVLSFQNLLSGSEKSEWVDRSVCVHSCWRKVVFCSVREITLCCSQRSTLTHKKGNNG